MIEQMKIGITLAMKGDATPKLKEFLKIVQRASQAVETLNMRLRPFNDNLMRMGDYLQKVNPRMRRFYEDTGASTRYMAGLNTSLKSGNREFSTLGNKLSSTSSKMVSLTRGASLLKDELAGLAAASAAVAASTAGMGSGSNSVGGDGSRRRSKSGGIHVRGSHFAGIGFTGAAIGVGLGLHGLHNAYETSKEYQRSLAQYRQQGFSESDNSIADQIASNVKTPGIGPVEMMNALTDAAMATRNPKMGRFLAPHLANIAMANNILYGDFSSKQEKDLIKFAELRGGSDPKKMLSALELGQKLYSMSGGRVQPSELLNFVKQASTAGFHLTDKALYELEPSIQERSGFKVGTGLQTGFNQLIGGKGISKKAEADLQHLGLMNAKGTLKNEKLLQLNPVEWFLKDYLSALKKAGITDELGIIKKTTFDFGRTFAAVASTWLKDKEKIARANEMSPQAKGEAASVQQAMNTPAGAEKILGASYERFNKKLGDFLMPATVGGMKELAKFLDHLTAIIGRVDEFFKTVASYESTLNGIVEKFMPSVKGEGDILKDVGKKQPKAQHITLNIDGRPFAHAIVPHLANSLNHTQIQQSNGFQASITPLPVSTLAPF